MGPNDLYLETDTGKFKVGVAGTSYNSAAYTGGGGAQVVLTAAGSSPFMVGTGTGGFANGVPAQLTNTKYNFMVSLEITTSGTAFTLNVGPTSTPATVFMQSESVTAGQQIIVPLYAGWYLEWAGTTVAIATQVAISL
jgi:hypothetical protein